MTVQQDLVLDVRKAIQSVDQVGAALTRISAEFGSSLTAALASVSSKRLSVTVTADTAPVTGAVTAAVDNADTAVTVTGDATELTGEVTGAVDAGDSEVTVTGDATPVTGAITAAVDAAPTGVSVTADASAIPGAVQAALDAAPKSVTVSVGVSVGGGESGQDPSEVSSMFRDLATAAIGADLAVTDVAEASAAAGTAGAAASGGIGGLSGALGTLKGAGAAVGITATVASLVMLGKSAIDAASDLGESSSKAERVFGENFGEIAEFAEGAAEAIGLSKQEAFEAAGTFGNLFQALGMGQGAAAAASQEVLTLAADLASFNNLDIAGTDGVLAKLQSGLVGEIEPLRRMGISFNAVQVEARAMEMGLADANGTISDGAKVQARLSLVTEQSSKARGDFARTSDQLANSQRKLSAEFKNAMAAIGVALLPSVLGVVSAIKEAMPVFVDFGSQIAKVFGTVIDAIIPVGESIIDMLVAIQPVWEGVVKGFGVGFAVVGPIFAVLAETIGGVATALGYLGSPILTAAGAFVGLSLAVGAVISAIGLIAPAVAAALGPIGWVAAAVGAVIVGYQALTGEAEEAAPINSELARTFTTVGAAARGASGPVVDLAENLNEMRKSGDLGEFGDALKANELFSDLTKVGFGIEEIAAALSTGAAGVRDFAAAAAEVQVGSLALQKMADSLGISVEELTRELAAGTVGTSFFGEGMGDLSYAERVAIGTTTQTIGAFEALQDQMQGASKTTLLEMQAEHLLTKAQSKLVDRLVATTGSFQDYTGALVEIREEQARVEAQIIGTGERLGDQRQQWVNLASDVGTGAVSLENVADIALDFKVPEETVSSFITTIQDGISSFVQMAVGNLPTASDAFDTFASRIDDAWSAVEAASEKGEGVKAAVRSLTEAADPSTFVNDLLTQAAALTTFSEDMETIAGMGLNRVYALLSSMDPLIAQQWAHTVANFPKGEAQAWEDALLIQQTALEGTVTKIGQAAPGVVVAMGDLARQTMIELGMEFDPAEPVHAGVGRATDELDPGGGGAGRGMKEEGGRLGSGVTDAFEEKLTPAERAAKAFSRVAEKIVATEAGLTSVSTRLGLLVGAVFATSIATGIRNWIPAIEEAAADAINRAESAARTAARAQSPSKLFMALGEDLSAGITLGMKSQSLTAGMTDIIKDLAAVAQVRIPSVEARVLTSVTAQPAQSNGTSGVTVNGPLVGSVTEREDALHVAAELGWRLTGL